MFNVLVFDDVVVSSAETLTRFDWSSRIGSVDQLALHCIVDNQNDEGNITVRLFHSADGRNFVDKSLNGGPSPPINNLAVPPLPAIANLAGGDAGGTPNLGFVRFKIELSGTTTRAHVKLYVTGRDVRG